MEATPDELLQLIEKMYPREFDRARAELLIAKQQQRIAELESINDSLLAQGEEKHSHSHD